jgi:hypothetical protein
MISLIELCVLVHGIISSAFANLIEINAARCDFWGVHSIIDKDQHDVVEAINHIYAIQS